MRGAVVDVHGEDEEDDIGDDEEWHEEREPPPERAEHGRRRRRAAPVLVSRPVAAVVPRAVAPVALALGPLLASSFAAGRVNGDHRRLAPPRHGAAGGGGRGRVAGWIPGGGALNASAQGGILRLGRAGWRVLPPGGGGAEGGEEDETRWRPGKERTQKENDLYF